MASGIVEQGDRKKREKGWETGSPSLSFFQAVPPVSRSVLFPSKNPGPTFPPAPTARSHPIGRVRRQCLGGGGLLAKEKKTGKRTIQALEGPEKSGEEGVQWSRGRLRTRPVALGKVRGITACLGSVRGVVLDRAYPVLAPPPEKSPSFRGISALALGSG